MAFVHPIIQAIAILMGTYAGYLGWRSDSEEGLPPVITEKASLPVYFSLGKPRPPPNSGIYDGRGQSKLALPGNNTQWSVGVLECWSTGVLECWF